MAYLANRVKVATATTGTGTVTLGSASSNAFCTFAEAGITDGQTVSYCIEDGLDFELGTGVYTSAGTTMTRASVRLSKISGTAGTSKINLSGNATVRIVAAKEDFFTPPANDGVALGASGTGFADLFLAAGGIINWDASDVRIIHSTNELQFVNAVDGYRFDSQVNPFNNDGGALGASGTAWSDLFLASGGVINFNAGNYTITHSAGLLTLSGPLSIGTSNALTSGTIELGAASDTTLARSGAGDVTIEGNAIYRAGGTDVPVTDGGTGASTAAGAATNLGLGTGDSPQFTAVNIGHASDTTLARDAAGIISVEGVKVALAGRQTIYIPATAMISRTTNGAAAGTAEKATNKNMFRTLDFDTNTQEFAQFSVHFPKSWNLSTVTFQPVWSHPSTTVNFGAVFGLAGVAISNDDAGDVAFGTAQTSTDTGGTTDDIYLGPESSAITIAGTPAADDWVMFQLNRTVSDGGDTLAVDARLHGIRLFFTTNAATDA